MGSGAMTVRYFKSANDFRRWLEKNHTTTQELWVGYFKKSSQQPSITWPESVDEALCFGWIDGVRRSLGDASYTIRFTPRKPRSIWSAVNIKRIKELIESGKVMQAGLDAFAKADERRSEVYSYERKSAELSPAFEKMFKARKDAWTFYRAQAPSYCRAAAHWVTSAKQ